MVGTSNRKRVVLVGLLYLGIRTSKGWYYLDLYVWDQEQVEGGISWIDMFGNRNR
jgi:hypothetical protein